MVPYGYNIAKQAAGYALSKAGEYAKGYIKRKAEEGMSNYDKQNMWAHEPRKKQRTGPSQAKTPREVRLATGGHTILEKSRSVNKRKKKKRVSKFWKKIRRTINNSYKYSHGQRTTVEFWQKYHITTANNGTTDDTRVNGYIDCAADQLGHGFIPLLSNQVMKAEFKTGEDGAATPSKFGILDPPPDVNNGGANAGNVNLVKDREVICIDSMLIRLYMSNCQKKKIMIWIVEWVCNESTNLNIVARTTDLYNDQQFFRENGAVAVAAPNLFKQPNFLISKVPHVQKYWKKGKFFKKVELKPGESMELMIPFTKIFWDLSKNRRENDDGNEYQYVKGLSRFLQISVRGQVGHDGEGEFGTSFFQKGGIQWQMSKKLVAHRIDRFGQEEKRYVINPPLTVTLDGQPFSETRPDPGTQAIKSQVIDIEETS